MKTSYFAKVADVKGAICIARGTPKFLNIPSYPVLAPTWGMINLKDMDEYTRQYGKMLLRLDPNIVWNDLMEMAQGEEPVICCYEKSIDFCHRHIVANWLEESLNVKIPELFFEQMVRGDNSMYYPETESLI